MHRVCVTASVPRSSQTMVVMLLDQVIVLETNDEGHAHALIERRIAEVTDERGARSHDANLRPPAGRRYSACPISVGEPQR